jgi:hypothetical protein
MPAADSGALAGHDFSERGNIAAEQVGILIIDLLNV